MDTWEVMVLAEPVRDEKSNLKLTGDEDGNFTPEQYAQAAAVCGISADDVHIEVCEVIRNAKGQIVGLLQYVGDPEEDALEEVIDSIFDEAPVRLHWLFHRTDMTEVRVFTDEDIQYGAFEVISVTELRHIRTFGKYKDKPATVDTEEYREEE